MLHLTDKEIVRERSQNWNTHISYAEDDTIVEVVVLEASKQGACPPEFLVIAALQENLARIAVRGFRVLMVVIKGLNLTAKHTMIKPLDSVLSYVLNRPTR